MTRPFSLAFRNQMLRRMTGRDAVSATQLAKEMGLRQQTLSRWLQEARRVPDVPPLKSKTTRRSVADKARILTEASSLTGDELADYLEREGVHLAELEQWRLALEDEASPSKATMKRIRKLERELAHKEKALAEAAALLVLKKKVEALWEDEDDDTDEGSGR
jgi:hypothetical protein